MVVGSIGIQAEFTDPMAWLFEWYPMGFEKMGPIPFLLGIFKHVLFSPKSLGK